MRGAIHHLDLTVRDPRASRSFYAAVLGFMGYREVADHDRGFDYDRASTFPGCVRYEVDEFSGSVAKDGAIGGIFGGEIVDIALPNGRFRPEYADHTASGDLGGRFALDHDPFNVLVFESGGGVTKHDVADDLVPDVDQSHRGSERLG